MKRSRLAKKPTRLYHGTARLLGIKAEKEGLKPTGYDVSDKLMKSPYSEAGYVYFFDDIERAKHFACGSAVKLGLGSMGEVFEVDPADVKVEPDPLLKDSWRVKGTVPAKVLKPMVFDCKKEKVTMFGRTDSLWNMVKLVGKSLQS